MRKKGWKWSLDSKRKSGFTRIANSLEKKRLGEWQNKL